MGLDAHPAAGMTAVDLFSGGGGAALGLRQAGVRCLAHVEWDKHACATLRAAESVGLIDGDVIEGDIRAVDWAPYVDVDLVWASPPCQAWSSAGQRLGAQDERNGWPWTWDAVDQIRPTWLICENVGGLLHHLAAAHTRTVPGTPGLFGDGEPTDVYDPAPNPARCARCYWDLAILPEARRRFPHVDYRVIDCADLGVPQNRERLILVCGPEPYRWPTMTHRDPEAVMAPGAPWVTVRQALGIGVEGIKTAHRPGERVADRARVDLTDSPAWTVSAHPGRGGGSMEARIGDVVQLEIASGGRRVPMADRVAQSIGDRPAATVNTRQGARGGAMMLVVREGGGRRVALKDRRLTPAGDAPSPAILGHDGGCGGGDIGVVHNGAVTRLPTWACAALQSFPPDWPWQGPKMATYRQIGNACPPPLVDALARQLVTP